MKKIIFNPIYIILTLILLSIILVNYSKTKYNKEKFIEVVEKVCMSSENINHISICEKYNKGEHKLDFYEIYSNTIDRSFSYFIIFLFVFSIASTFRFHRYIHSGFIKNILCRSRYKKVIFKEISYSLFSVTYLTTMFYMIAILVSLVFSERFVEFDYYEILISYINTLLSMLIYVSLSIIYIKKINNIVLYMLISFLTMFSVISGLEILSNLLPKFKILYKIANNIFPILSNQMNLFFIHQLAAVFILLFLVSKIYKNKEALLIESEK